MLSSSRLHRVSALHPSAESLGQDARVLVALGGHEAERGGEGLGGTVTVQDHQLGPGDFEVAPTQLGQRNGQRVGEPAVREVVPRSEVDEHDGLAAVEQALRVLGRGGDHRDRHAVRGLSGGDGPQQAARDERASGEHPRHELHRHGTGRDGHEFPGSLTDSPRLAGAGRRRYSARKPSREVAMSLKGKRVAILAENLYQEMELWVPYYRMKE